jgi:acyl-CoA synthetase (AMP-forming)/AMP-acid ligase II
VSARSGAGRPNDLPITIDSGVRTASRRTPNKIALAEGDRQLSYTQLVDRINQVSTAALHDLQLNKGDHVALFAPNCLEFIEIVCGLAAIGCPVAMVPPGVSPREVAHICNDSGAKVLFVHANFEELARSADLRSVERFVVINNDYDEWRGRAQANEPDVALLESDVFCIPYTSGTTGNPKGCLLSHRARTTAFYAMAVEFGCYSPDDRALAIAPLYHGAGFAFAMAPIFFGGFCQILPSYDSEQVLRLVSEMELTNIFMVPTYFHRMFSLEPAVLNKYQPKSLKAIISGAAPLLQDTKETIVDYFGDGLLFETYGSTEGGFVTDLRPADQLRKERCVGQAFPNTQVRVLDDEGNDVAQGEVGEVHGLSTTHFNGYWGMPDATESCFNGAWLAVGDMGRFDEEGYLYLVDRKKDVIISGGVNVYPREIEEILQSHPAMLEVAVIGVADAEWGEAVKAVMVLGDGQNVSQDELLSYCRERLAKYKLPKYFSRVDALPRNSAGKVLKGELRTQEEKTT